MDVSLYVYDLSRGLARQMSRQFLGIQIDAIYHTSIVFKGIEYFFGAGVQTCSAGQTHHGRPMEVVPLGKTSLPEEVILEYLDSLKQVYTAESYDLFMHNCNNFSHDFAMFLTGKGIPSHITSLPQTVLDTPFGQMLRPQIDAAMRPVTQAPLPSQLPAKISENAGPVEVGGGRVLNVTSLDRLTDLLAKATDSCAVVFFTSSTCAPCKMAYPAYDQLASEAGNKCTLIKVDINQAHAIASRYNVRATPTFKTFLKGNEQETWTGADPSRLLGTVRVLIESAYPPHPHTRLHMPALKRASRDPVLYSKTPPLDKLIAKLGQTGRESAVQKIVEFIKVRNQAGSQEAALPDLKQFSALAIKALETTPVDALFAVFDLFRIVLVDPRVSGFYASEQDARTISQLLQHVNSLESCPYNLRLVTIHLGCNIFSSPIGSHAALSGELAKALVTLITNSLLDLEHTNLRVAASSLAFNITNAEQLQRQAELQGEKARARLDDSLLVDLAASLLQVLSEEENPDAVHGLALSIAHIALYADPESDALDLCRAMDASQILSGRKPSASKNDQSLLDQIAKELLIKGLKPTP